MLARPATHGSQPVARCAAFTLAPLAHTAHAAQPRSLYCPASQALHCSTPPTSLPYCPAAHTSHSVWSSLAALPDLHVWHDVEL